MASLRDRRQPRQKKSAGKAEAYKAARRPQQPDGEAAVAAADGRAACRTAIKAGYRPNGGADLATDRFAGGLAGPASALDRPA